MEKRWGATGFVACAVVAAMWAGQPASAGILLETGSYQLTNHGTATASPFGRIGAEQVAELGRGRNRLAFSFDHRTANVMLSLTQVGEGHYTLRVFGTAWGTFLRRNNPDPIRAGRAQIDFEYDLVYDSETEDMVFMTGTATRAGKIFFKGKQGRFFDPSPARQFAFDINGSKEFSGAALLARRPPPYRWGGKWPLAVADTWTFSVRGSTVPAPGCAALLGASLLVGARRKRSRAGTTRAGGH